LILEECGQVANESISNSNNKMSVLILTLDSVSKNQLERIMPSTFKYLTSQPKETVFFENLNTIGVNTYPNIVPLLTGMLINPPEELNLTRDYHFYRNIETYHDFYPFIWREYEKAGYLTLYQEELPFYGTFNYLKNGFRYKPTAFFGHSLWLL
jgi:hypothetical protein